MSGTATPAPVCAGTDVTFTASCSIAKGHTHSLKWTYGDGASDSAPGGQANLSTTHAYGAAGTFTITLSCGGYSDSKQIKVYSLTSTTVAQTPADTARHKIGVCEEVVLTASDEATFDLVGDGILVTTSPTTARFSAADSAGTATVKATFSDGHSCSIEFTVITPTGLTYTNVGGTWHEQWTCSAGFRGYPKLLPTDVSFYNIRTQEQVVAAVCTRYWLPIQGQLHPLGPWAPVDEDNVIRHYDYVASRSTVTPYDDGTLIWDIPWNLRREGDAGGGYTFKTFRHKTVSTPTGRCTRGSKCPHVRVVGSVRQNQRRGPGC